MKLTFSLIALVAAFPAFAESTRQLDAHVHGVGTLNIAIDGEAVEMEFHAPGADIVGFEYEAESDADLAAIDAAIATLESPMNLFVLPSAAGCTLTGSVAELEEEGAHDDEHDHGHKEDGHDEHAHDEHKDEEHAHDEHAHDEHKDEEHAHDDHGHEDHGHGDHAEEASHTEFHAEYVFACENPDALNEITFAYFETFPNALEVEVQLVTAGGAQAFEVERDAAVLNLER